MRLPFWLHRRLVAWRYRRMVNRIRKRFGPECDHVPDDILVAAACYAAVVENRRAGLEPSSVDIETARECHQEVQEWKAHQ